MSRIGNSPVPVEKGVKVSFSDNLITVEGAKGKLTQGYIGGITFEQNGDIIVVKRPDDEKKTKALHGLYRALLNNMIIGVSKGFTRSLQINGVGYRAEAKGKSLLLNLGYSTQVEYVIPEGITGTVENNTKITLSGISKELVGKTASEIRSIRPPEPYKGKGIKYEEEVIKRKVGKTAKK